MKRKSVGIELRSLNNLMKRRFDDFADSRQLQSVTGTNGWIIRFLDENADRDIYQKDLEEQFTITRSTVSKVLILMEKKGLVERRGVPQDSRLKKLVLTDKARQLTALMKEYGNKTEQALTKGFTPEELETLYGYIQRMKDNMKSKPPDRPAFSSDKKVS